MDDLDAHRVDGARVETNVIAVGCAVGGNLGREDRFDPLLGVRDGCVVAVDLDNLKRNAHAAAEKFDRRVQVQTLEELYLEALAAPSART